MLSPTPNENRDRYLPYIFKAIIVNTGRIISLTVRGNYPVCITEPRDSNQHTWPDAGLVVSPSPVVASAECCGGLGQAGAGCGGDRSGITPPAGTARWWRFSAGDDAPCVDGLGRRPRVRGSRLHQTA
ncbi:hypothetical protein BaRGS_00007512 [Batillaria attramentaria]|uniref:Uncharacterized protein n=1 Tax=Batillaria attramentaria TaxID=370345 RepID=A0ABD0LQX2_9CAEN